ncbi:MAG: hypothetical protein KC561_02210 [Myxococcales bacterium]|nr:hypothetical protein [Myxococcales bacterium]
MRQRRFVLFALASLALFLVACGEDSNTPGPGGADVTDDSTTGDMGGEVSTDTNSCGSSNACISNSDCGDGEQCVSRCCQTEQVTEQCVSVGQTCTGSNWDTDDFLCNADATGSGECLSRCDSEDQATCNVGSFCGELSDSARATDDFDGVCFEGDCNDSCFAEGAGCEADDLYTCNGGAGTCYATANGASFCDEAGTGDEGDDCDADNLCAPGLFCIQGSCEVPCEIGGDSCDNDQECVPMIPITGDNEPGFCRTLCEPFSVGQCPEGFECEVGFNRYTYEPFEWTCRLVDDELPVRVEGESCSRPNSQQGTEPTDRCAEGTVCAADAPGGTGVCRIFCDASGSSIEGLCPVSEPGDAIFGEEETVGNFNVLDFAAVGTGSYHGIGAFLRDGTDEEGLAINSSGAELFSGDTATAILSLSESSLGSYTLHLFEEAPAEVVESEGYGAEFFNTLSDPMDAYYVTAEQRVMTSSSDTITVSPLTNWFGWEDDDEVTEFAFLGLDEGFRVGSVYQRAGSVAELFLIGEFDNENFPIRAVWMDQDYPSGESDEIAIRLMHAFVDHGSLSARYERDGVVYPLESLEFGEFTDWILVPNDKTIQIQFLDGETFVDAQTFNPSELSDGSGYTFSVYQKTLPEIQRHPVLSSPSADAWNVVVTNLTLLDYLEIAFAARMLADPIPAGGYAALGDSLTGDSVLSDNVRLLFADSQGLTAGDPPALIENTVYAEGEVTTNILHYTPAGIDLFDFHGEEYDASGLDGEAALRYVNISGAGETLLRFPGLSEYVCEPVNAATLPAWYGVCR